MPARSTLRSGAALVDAELVPRERLVELEKVAARYAVAVTPGLADLIDPTDPDDPIARQFVPAAAELASSPEEDGDPIGDVPHMPVQGVVHRYPDRVLLKLTHVCAVYCRFCFRREMVGPGGAQVLSSEAIEKALAYVTADAAIWEVILTGGDPLLVSPRRLRAVIERLAEIPHVKVLRVHTRLPVADPQAITSDLVAALKAFGRATYVVLHANHARELTEAVRAACDRFVDAGIPMLSQSVLLRGVNDDAESLSTLLRTLVECRIKPYYLHQGDLAPGTSHLRTTIGAGQDLMRALRGRLSGLCQPHYVLDIPGGYGKVPIGPTYLREEGECVSVEDIDGRRHAYPPSKRGTGDSA